MLEKHKGILVVEVVAEVDDRYNLTQKGWMVVFWSQASLPQDTSS